MTENERVRTLRKAKGLTLEKFGERVGLKRSSLSMVETGVNAVSPQLRRSICREFGVREEWLRDGSGPMEAGDQRTLAIDEAVNRLMSGETADFKRRLIIALSALDESQWVFLRQKMEEIVGVSASTQPPEQPDAPDAQELARQILQDKRAEDASPVSSGGVGRKKEA